MHPNVSWQDAIEFCKRLSHHYNKAKYRLPSETEWEYACRAGTTTKFFFGDNELDLGKYAWFEGNSKKKLHPVGQKPPNPFGLYDIHGNVLEWCQDCWHSDYKNAPTDGSA